jgi:hypothetical protein
MGRKQRQILRAFIGYGARTTLELFDHWLCAPAAEESAFCPVLDSDERQTDCRTDPAWKTAVTLAAD